MKNNKKDKLIFIVFIIFFFIVFSYSVFNLSYTIVNSINDEDFSYTTESNIDYKIYLKENDFYDNQYLESSKSYVSSFIDYISMDLEYEYNSNKKVDLNVSNEIKVILKAYYEEDLVWDKTYPIKQLETKQVDDIDNYNITESLIIDWDKYLYDVNSYMEVSGITVKAILEVIMDVSIKNDVFDDGDTLLAVIPLTEEVFKINDSDKGSQVMFNDKEYIVEYAVYCLLLIISLGSILLISKKLGSYKKKESFETKMKRIKKDYDNIVVETKNMVNIKGLKPVAITSFDEMLNLANSIISPIMLYEESNLGCFYIVKNDLIYLYIIKD